MVNPEEISVSAIAVWMLAEIDREDIVYQDTLVYEIERRFGPSFTYVNDNGNSAIRRDVLTAFRNISETTVVWNRRDRAWRKREPRDEPGRQQLD